MQDEIAKHTKEILKTVAKPNHTFAEKVKDVLLEIGIIVFAVSLSIWFHGWSEHRHEQKDVKSFLTALKPYLAQDTTYYKNKTELIAKQNNFEESLKLSEAPEDSLMKITMSLDLTFSSFRPNETNGQYEGFKSSGKLNTIEDENLRSQIVTYYQETLPTYSWFTKFSESTQEKISVAAMEFNGKPDGIKFIKSRKGKYLLTSAVKGLQARIGMSDSTYTKATILMTEIDKYLKK